MSERKDIDAIVGATVKLEESLNKRISELENIVQKIDGFNANVNLCRHNTNELKEDNKNRSVETTKLMQVYIDLKITLRDFFWALDDYFESKDQKKFQKIFRKLHKKLDSRTDWIKDMADGPQQEIEWRRREKASGGEKESLNEREEVACDRDTLPLRDDSKPPEPKTCYNCGWLDHEFCRNTIAVVHACGGESCWKPKEPSENDYRTLMDELKEEPEFRLGREYERKELIAEFVKRLKTYDFLEGDDLEDEILYWEARSNERM